MEQPTPAQAAATLADIPDPTRTPSARVVGLTWMVWGFAFAVGLLATAHLLPVWTIQSGDTVYGFETQMAWFAIAMVVPVALAAFVTTRIWSAQAFLPAGRPGLRLALAAFGAALAGYVLMWLLGFLLLLTNELVYAVSGWSPSFSLRGGLGGVLAVAAWAAWFGTTRWNHPVQSRRVGFWLAGGLVVATIPLGVVARLGDAAEAVVSVAGAFLVMAAFTWLGARLYARG